MVLGRTEERARIDRLLADARLSASGVLVIAGEPGIGKTALLEYAARAAAEAGMETLGARGAEFEAEIPFGGLLELLRPALGDLHALPPAQAEALRGALDLGPQLQPDRYLIGAATLNLLSARAERAPLLVLADDAHWLDESSLGALLFAARRLLADPVAVLVAARAGESPALAAARLPELALGGIDPETAAALLVSHGAPTPPPGTAERLVQATGGNPLALVELARGAGELDTEPLAGPLAFESGAEAAYRRRIDALGIAAQEVLALAAAEESGRLATIVAAARAAGLDPGDLDAGERAGLAAIAAGVLAWRHPLARSAAYRAVAADRRRALHAALAGVLDHRSQLDRRAWHLAAAALGPDAAVAAALDGAARRARARSAHASAAAAAERAAALSDSPDERARRLYDAAEAAWLGGHATRALQSIEEALELAPAPHLRAELDHLRGQAAIRAGELMQGHEILVAGAQAIERIDPAKAVVMLAEAAEACIYLARPRRMLEVSRRAWELLSPGAGERERFFANLALGTASLYNGVREDGAARIREALAILEASETLSAEPRSLSSAALAPLWLRDSGEERALIERGVASARARAALGTLPLALALVGRDAATSDRPALAAALFEEAAGLARETGQEMPLCAALTWLAGVEARQGREPECRAHAEEAMALAVRRGLAFLELCALEALGELERRLRRLRALLPAGLRRQPRQRLAAGARRRAGEAAGRRRRRRRRLRPRRVDAADGRGLPRLALHRLRLPRRVDRARARARRGRRPLERALRGRPGVRLHRRGLRPGDDVRLPARHGGPGRRRAPPARRARAGRHVDDRRAVRQRSRRGQPQPGGADLLRGLDAAVHARLAVAGGRAGARRAGRRGAPERRRHRGRLQPRAPRGRDAVQYRARGAAVTAGRRR